MSRPRSPASRPPYNTGARVGAASSVLGQDWPAAGVTAGPAAGATRPGITARSASGGSRAKLVGKDLTEYSLDTVRMFHDDARAAGYTL